jgi:hypothetical protein
MPVMLKPMEDSQGINRKASNIIKAQVRDSQSADKKNDGCLVGCVIVHLDQKGLNQ